MTKASATHLHYRWQTQPERDARNSPREPQQLLKTIVTGLTTATRKQLAATVDKCLLLQTDHVSSLTDLMRIMILFSPAARCDVLICDIGLSTVWSKEFWLNILIPYSLRVGRRCNYILGVSLASFFFVRNLRRAGAGITYHRRRQCIRRHDSYISRWSAFLYV